MVKKKTAPVPTAEHRPAPSSGLTNGAVTAMLTEALLALAHSPLNAERACQGLRDVTLAVAGGAEPDVSAVARLLSELLDLEPKRGPDNASDEDERGTERDDHSERIPRRG